MKELLGMSFIFGTFFLSLLGTLCVRMPQAGIPLLGVLAALSYAGVRLWRDARRGSWVRRLSLAFGVLCGLIALGGTGTAFVERDYMSFMDWHAAGGGVRPGMTVEEARRQLAASAVVLDAECSGGAKACFQLKPTGLASWRWEFPIDELYYVDAQVDSAGRIVSVKAWHD